MSHLYKQKDTYWIAYYRQGKLHRKSLRTKDKSTAKYLQAKQDQDIAENKQPSLNPPIDSVLNEYDLSVKTHKRPATHYRDMRNIRRYLSHSLDQRMNDITEKSLQDYFNSKITSGIAVPTVNRNMASIKAFLNFALRRKYIHDNPMKEIRQYREIKNPPRFLTKDEIVTLLKMAKDTDLYPCVATAIYTGARQAELFHLEWQDIDLLQNTVTICNKDGFTTKSKKFRVIPLHPALKSILSPIARGSGPCFDIVNHRRVFGRIIRKSKLRGDIGWHTLRHTFASQLVMSRADIVTVSKLLGHADLKTTMIYSHLTKEHEQEAVERLSF